MKIKEHIDRFELKKSSLDKICDKLNKLKTKYAKKYEKLSVDFIAGDTNEYDEYIDVLYIDLYGTREATKEEIEYRKDYYKRTGIKI